MIASHPASFPIQSCPRQPDLPRFHLRARVCVSNLIEALQHFRLALDHWTDAN
jgi:hypothetical protein